MKRFPLLGKLSGGFILSLFLSLVFIFNISADTTYSQFVDFFDYSPAVQITANGSPVSFSNQGISSVVLPEFPTWSGHSGHYARKYQLGQYSAFSGSFRLEEVYTIPYDFVWSGQALSLTYVVRHITPDTTGSSYGVPWEVAFTLQDEVGIEYTETAQNNGHIFTVVFDLSNLSSRNFTKIKFTSSWEYIDPVVLGPSHSILSGVFPFTVSQTFSEAEALSQATIDAIVEGNTSLRHIEERQQDLLDAQREQTAVLSRAIEGSRSPVASQKLSEQEDTFSVLNSMVSQDVNIPSVTLSGLSPAVGLFNLVFQKALGSELGIIILLLISLSIFGCIVNALKNNKGG